MTQAAASKVSSSVSQVEVGIGVGQASRVMDPTDAFAPRHIAPSPDEVAHMLRAVGVGSLDELIDQTVPGAIRTGAGLGVGAPRGERELLEELRQIASRNQVWRSYLGTGYYGAVTPAVIQRNILENPGWYTQYTPYQAEIAQGRLEALLNFQTMVSDLTGLKLAGASLLDEATAAAEAMAMCFAVASGKKTTFLVAADCHPQTIAVLKTRGEPQGVQIVVQDAADFDFSSGEVAGCLVQYPATDGRVADYAQVAEKAHAAGAMVVAATDLLALTVLKAPGEWGADVAVGSSQRFGVPMGFGGPHAAFFATHEQHARKMPGRIIGVSRDAHGNIAYRMAIQTREQHIKRDRATSNICTAQALLAIMAGMYAVYHGPQGLKRIGTRTHAAASALASAVTRYGHALEHEHFFDTIRVRCKGGDAGPVLAAAAKMRINLRDFGDGTVGVSLDETVSRRDLRDLAAAFNNGSADVGFDPDDAAEKAGTSARLPGGLVRTSPFCTHPVFNTYHAEHELLRYMKRLENKDLSLAHSMIALGSCTMKLNATSEMLPVTWPEFGALHPFAPRAQTGGYRELFATLEGWLADITGFDAVSLQPNAGAQGEYAGLLVIRAYHHDRGEAQRDVCLIPTSAHGTNPASAVMAGFKVVAVRCDEDGNVDLADLRAKAEANADKLGALMVTYPSTHGVFEGPIREICAIVHEHGGQVYMDGANMNAQVGLTTPAACGADVCHLNLHKTFCIPHGGGGPGMGPIGVRKHLQPFLPGHPVVAVEGQTDKSIGPVSAAPYGSPSILPISWMYIGMMGAEGLRRATEVAILNANYMAKRLEGHYDVVYTGLNGRVAHEFIVDCRPFDKGGAFDAGIKVDDIAKRLMDFGFHAPTMSWPVPGTLMIEPTESESMAELDRFCDAMIAIRAEIGQIHKGELDREDNPLKHAPHTAEAVSADHWPHAYTRAQAAYPLPWVREQKFWPSVGRVDNPYGDRNLVCTCPSVEELAQQG